MNYNLVLLWYQNCPQYSRREHILCEDEITSFVLVSVECSWANQLVEMVL